MINLIKNELTKIIHKPGLYILLAFSFAFIVLSAFVNNVEIESIGVMQSYYEGLEDEIELYDLSDPEELHYYISDKSSIEIYELYKDYSISSPEYYFVDNDIAYNIRCMNEAKYRDKDDEKYNLCKSDYDKQVSLLRNFDWKQKIENEIKVNKESIISLEASKTGNTIDDKTIDEQIAYINEEIRVGNYRLEHDIAPTYKEVSSSLDSYLNYFTEYQTLDLDESNYTNKGALENKRDVESSYQKMKYQLEHDMLKEEKKDFTADSLVWIFMDVDIFLVIAAIMIVGTIISEEFNKGTIKQLLLKPFTRTTVLTSKIIASLLAFLGFIVVYSLITLLVNVVVSGGGSSLLDPILVYDFSKSAVVEYNVFVYMLLHFLAVLPEYLIIMLVVLLMGIITTNTAGSIITGFILYTVSGLLYEFLYIDSLVFLPMIHWNFIPYLFGGLHWFENATLGLSLFIVAITMIILIIVSYVVFKNKDIKNQ